MAKHTIKYRPAPEGVLKVIPLGGIGEIGKNMTAIEYGEDIIVIDVGSTFPGEDKPGIDLVIPLTTYLKDNRDRVRAFFVTHGHEDHIGGAPYILGAFPNAAVYATRLTCALIESKLKEARIHDVVDLHEVEPGETIITGVFAVEFIKVSHSIAGACALGIHTPVGVLVHSGDFKVDYTPIDGQMIDLQRLAALGQQGVRLLMCESTNVERPGFTMSEKKVGETFHSLFEKAEGRIIIAMFASNVHRIQMVIDAAAKFNRRVCLVGHGMVTVSKLSAQLGYLNIPDGMLAKLEEIDRYKDSELVILTTGSQGEAASGLTRMAFGEHKKIDIRPSDTIVLSSTPIPGNEKSVAKVLNTLVKTGANVIYDALQEVHVSGHARQEELKLMHALVKPQCFIPVHGEYRHLFHHAKLAEALGENPKNIIIPELGQVIELTEHEIRRGGTVPAGEDLIDGLSVGDINENVLRDRRQLSGEGVIIIILCFDRDYGTLINRPEIICRGFVNVKENEQLIEGVRDVVDKLLNTRLYELTTTASIKQAIRDAVKKYLNDTARRDPMIIPWITE